jgi:tripartite-type tricarboxylate transporter receptor subunit TctC
MNFQPSWIALLIVLFATTVQAQTAVRVLTGYPPGGTVDILARIFAERLGEALGRPVVVEPRAGAAGQIAVEAVRNAPPDGNTLLVTNESALTLYPHTVKKLPYDAVADFTAIAHLGGSQNAFAVNAGVPANDLAAFVSWGKANPKGVTYGSGGYGSNQHFLGLLLAQATGVTLVHVPYRGVGPVITDLVGGQLPAGMLPLGTLLPQARSGKVRILAHSGSMRSPLAPDVPTFRELGFAPLELQTWFGMFGPAGMRPELVARYNEIVVQGLRTPAVRERMRSFDLEIRELSAAGLAAQFKAEHNRWAQVVKSSGFTAESP